MTGRVVDVADFRMDPGLRRDDMVVGEGSWTTVCQELPLRCRRRDIIDLGDLTACRAMESLAPLWIRLNDKFGHVWFNLAVLRKPG